MTICLKAAAEVEERGRSGSGYPRWGGEPKEEDVVLSWWFEKGFGMGVDIDGTVVVLVIGRGET